MIMVMIVTVLTHYLLVASVLCLSWAKLCWDGMNKTPWMIWWDLREVRACHACLLMEPEEIARPGGVGLQNFLGASEGQEQ